MTIAGHSREWSEGLTRHPNVVGFTLHPHTATVTFRLACGHDVVFTVASHPIAAIEIEALYVDPGGNLACPTCATVVPQP